MKTSASELLVFGLRAWDWLASCELSLSDVLLKTIKSAGLLISAQLWVAVSGWRQSDQGGVSLDSILFAKRFAFL